MSTQTVTEASRRISSGATEIIQEDELLARLERSERTGRPLRIKLGVDPSRPDLHLGHAVVLRKLRTFQDLGHQIILLIGDFTGRIGDPSGKSTTRPQLTEEEVERNAQTYLDQAGLVLDLRRAEIRHNSEWLEPLGLGDLIRLMGTFTVARMLEREEFQRRFTSERPIHLHEFLYPLMQGYDSVALEADVELGGTDQKFNLLAARQIQREFGQEPEIALLMPLLVGLDGREKMSKSVGNDIPITLPPDDMYGSLMSVPDDLIVSYMELAAGALPDAVDDLRTGLAQGRIHPRDAKARMAEAVVSMFAGKTRAREAAERFDAVFRRHDLDQELPERQVPADLLEEGGVRVVRLVTALGLVASASEARRLLAAGGIEIDGERPRVADATWKARDGAVLRVGRHRFARLRLNRS